MREYDLTKVVKATIKQYSDMKSFTSTFYENDIKLPVQKNWVILLTSTRLIESVRADYWKNDKVLHN